MCIIHESVTCNGNRSSITAHGSRRTEGVWFSPSDLELNFTVGTGHGYRAYAVRPVRISWSHIRFLWRLTDEYLRSQRPPSCFVRVFWMFTWNIRIYKRSSRALGQSTSSNITAGHNSSNIHCVIEFESTTRVWFFFSTIMFTS